MNQRFLLWTLASLIAGDLLAADTSRSAPDSLPVSSGATSDSLLDFKFTNELGEPVSLNDFRGQALGITFFFTSCPIPNFCPRLSKNFQEASEKLRAVSGGPTNWHFISVSFDTRRDTPPVLKAYAEKYHYDPAHWTFLTGPAEQISELAHQCGIEVSPDGASLNHNFRTLIINASGKLQREFPFGGDLSELIAAEMLKACAATNQMNPAINKAR